MRTWPLMTLGVMAGYAALAACPSATGTDDGTGNGTDPLVTDATAAAECATIGLEDFGEVLTAYMVILQKADRPFLMLPVGYGYNPATGAFNFEIDLGDDPSKLVRVAGTAHPGIGTDLNSGLQAGDGVGAHWSGIYNQQEWVYGAFGFAKLAIESGRLTLAQVIDSSDGRVYADPTFLIAGSCDPVVVTQLEVMIDPISQPGGVVTNIDLGSVSLGFRASVSGSSDTLEAWCLLDLNAANNIASGTASFRGSTFAVKVDFNTFEVTLSGPVP